MRNYREFAVVIPSYNEVENLRILLKRIHKELPEAAIVIVDDSSSIENNKLKKIVEAKKHVILISRLKKEGRGSAVLEGFGEALKNKNIQYIFEMDSDLAHDPKEFTRFIRKMDKIPCGLIIGSRYLPGGKIKNIERSRTVMSRLINTFLYFWLYMKLTDHSSGFRLYDRPAIEFLTKIKIDSKGFITLSETAYKLFLNGYKISEVPITWNYRRYGKSNVNLKELLNSLYFVIKMRLINLLSSNSRLGKFLVVLFIFFLSLFLRTSTLNQMGRTWDEIEYIEQGYKLDELISKGDFNNSYFYTTYDHPPLVKYIYGITAHFDQKGLDKNNNPVFNYDLTYSRLLSAVFGSLSAVLIVLFAWEYISPYAGFLSGIIFSTLPFFVGLSQLVSTESILMLLFTSSVYSFIRVLEKISIKKIIITGILTGLALLSKQSNVLLFTVFLSFYLFWYLNNKREKLPFLNKRLISIIIVGIISVITAVIIWPMPYSHLDVISGINEKIWLVKTSPPVIFWGKLILAPKIYFIVLYFITTPLLILIVSLLGLKKIEQKRNWIWFGLILWFLIPFFQSLYAWRANGIRYIIEIYAPLSVIAALGIIFVAEKLKLAIRGRAIIASLVLIYMVWALNNVKPYYLDYFNLLVGGSSNVYHKQYFELGWWGQGLREAGYYLRDNAKQDSKVGLFVSPAESFPPLNNLNLTFIEKDSYNPKIKYDYIVVNYFHVLREGFDDTGIKKDYKLIHQVIAGGAPIVDIYSSK